MCILNLSKVMVYKFHYDYNENNYGSKSRLLFTDTERLMYQVKTEDIYENFSRDKATLDLVTIALSQNVVMVQTI